MKFDYRRKRLFGILAAVFVLIVVAIGGYQLIATPSQALAAQAHSAKYPKAIQHRKSRAVCSKTVAYRANCAAFIATNNSGAPLTGTPALTSSLGPVEFHTAYNLPCTPGGPVASVCSTPGSFGPSTIAVVDAGSYSDGSGTVEESLQNYDSQYGLPACTAANGCLTIVNQSGVTSPLPPSSGWALEIALDVETAHMVCQTCKIVLVETNDDFLNNLSAGVVTAATFNPVAISNSWYYASNTPADEQGFGLDSDFVQPGIAIVAATGDIGSTTVSWPADNPNVIGAAGTTLQLNNDNTWAGETVWSGSGGTCSGTYSAPSWQTNLAAWGTNGCGAFKAFGDVSADADPSSGAAVNEATSSSTSSWWDVGGTSLATPIISGIFGLIGKVPTGVTGSTIPYGSYNSSNFHDVTSGTNCANGITLNCTAAVGFDTPSGLGTPFGIGGFTPPPTQPTGLSAIDASESQINLSWTASTDNLSVSSYHIYRNGVQVATTASTSYNDTGLSPNTSYSYSVTAYDTVNNASPASTSTSATTRYLADINQDGHVNLQDFSLLSIKFGQSGGSLGRADINQDGHVNLQDFSLLSIKFGIE